MSKFPNSYSHF